MKANRSMTPPEGWHYDQAMPGGGIVTIREMNFDRLKEAIFTFRLANNIAQGDIERDIDGYICKNYGSMFCAYEATDMGYPADVPQDRRMSERVAEWVSNMNRKRPFQLVSLQEADRRQKICAGCHRNRSWDTNCAGCDQRVLAVSSLIREIRPPSAHNARGCTASGWDCDSAAHLTAKDWNLTDEVRGLLSPQCWARDQP